VKREIKELQTRLEFAKKLRSEISRLKSSPDFLSSDQLEVLEYGPNGCDKDKVFNKIEGIKKHIMLGFRTLILQPAINENR